MFTFRASFKLTSEWLYQGMISFYTKIKGKQLHVLIPTNDIIICKFLHGGKNGKYKFLHGKNIA